HLSVLEKVCMALHSSLHHIQRCFHPAQSVQTRCVRDGRLSAEIEVRLFLRCLSPIRKYDWILRKRQLPQKPMPDRASIGIDPLDFFQGSFEPDVAMFGGSFRSIPVVPRALLLEWRSALLWMSSHQRLVFRKAFHKGLRQN